MRDPKLALVKRYFKSISEGLRDDAIERFFTQDVVQEEFPNRLLPHGARRDLQGMKDAAARGKGVMASQRLEVVNAVSTGDHLAIEAKWSGTLAISIAPTLQAGDEMRARFAVFFEFRDGKIAAQRNYDCFEPW
ncbi:MAG: nuclear transport factor 2 family protein [Gemmatimonadales bacterium]|nr:nuclear transport factor 2 family protein [Gemmatimonadales bacterium]